MVEQWFEDQLHDYNGPGSWGHVEVKERYRELCRVLGAEAAGLTARESETGNIRRIYPIMESVIDLARRGDRAAIELCVQFIESTHRQAFGRVLHANAARALRKSALSAEQQHRLRSRILDMLRTAWVPREFHDYARLLRKLGYSEQWQATRAAVDEANPYVMRWVRQLEINPTREGA